MDLQAITQTLTSRNIKVLHLEPTDVCQAACPQCFREIDKSFDKSQKNYLTVEQLDRMLPNEFIANLDKMFMCGNYGDPAASHYAHEIYNYFRLKNPNITLGMNSNGAIQTPEWWAELAKILSHTQDYVVFSIDGLEDTNQKYRVNVNWSNLMTNAQAFINAGGNAHWDMLVYKHNQHQVDSCENLAREMGFKWFRAKVSKRPLIANLEHPVGWALPDSPGGEINCHALNDQSVYIDAQGRISPCCWLGTKQNIAVINFDNIQKSWHSSNPNSVCVDKCNTKKLVTSFSSQWQREVELC